MLHPNILQEWSIAISHWWGGRNRKVELDYFGVSAYADGVRARVLEFPVRSIPIWVAVVYAIAGAQTVPWQSAGLGHQPDAGRRAQASRLVSTMVCPSEGVS